MRHFKNAAGVLFAIEPDGSQDELIQPDWEELSEQAAEALRAPTVPQRIEALRSQIRQRELEEQLPHGIRVFVMGSMEDSAMSKAGLTRAAAQTLLYQGNPGYRRLKDFHDEITGLEAQVTALEAQL